MCVNQATQPTYEQMAAFLEREIGTGSAEIFVCWEHDEAVVPVRRLHVWPSDVRTLSITLQEGDLLTITS